MRINKGKAVFSRKDTFGLNYTLQPIILAGLVNFKEVLVSSEFSSFPSSFVKGNDVTDKEVKEF